MVGGTSKMKFLQEKLKKEFPKLNVVTQYENNNFDHQLMVVQGAAFLGASKMYYSRHSYLYNCQQPDIAEITDAIPLALGFKVCNKTYDKDPTCNDVRMSVIMEKNTPYPNVISKTYCQHTPDSTRGVFDLYEGDSLNPHDNYFLGQLSITDVPKRDPNICDTEIIELSIDKAGIATIIARINPKYETHTNVVVKKIAVATNDGLLTQEEVVIQRNQVRNFIPDSKLREIVKELLLNRESSKGECKESDVATATCVS